MFLSFFSFFCSTDYVSFINATGVINGSISSRQCPATVFLSVGGHTSFFYLEKQRFGLVEGGGDWNNGEDLKNEFIQLSQWAWAHNQPKHIVGQVLSSSQVLALYLLSLFCSLVIFLNHISWCSQCFPVFSSWLLKTQLVNSKICVYIWMRKQRFSLFLLQRNSGCS